MSVRLTQQQLDAIQLPPEVVVSASAGSGKTEVLVRRVIEAALGQGIPLDRMLIVTFTRSAAAELRERLRKSLGTDAVEGLGLSVPPQALRAQLAALNRAQISTIHSFCLDVVQRFGYGLGLSAQRILPDDEARMLRHELLGDLLRQRLDAAEPDLRAAALAWGGSDGVGPEDLASAARSSGLRDILLRLHDFRGSLPDSATWFARHLGYAPLDPERCDAEQLLVKGALNLLRRWSAELTAASRKIANELRAAGTGANAAALLAQRCMALDKLSACSDWNDLTNAFAGLDECLDLPYKPKGLLANYARDVEDPGFKERIKELAERGQKEAKELRTFHCTPWPEVAARENETQRRLIALWRLAEEFDALYSQKKRERGAVDYADLEAATLALLHEPGLALQLQSQFDLVLVDEYQDTSPIQDAILELVATGSPRRRFLVGDLKQSIYAFRLAEPSLFTAHQQRLADSAADGHALRLTGSFRSRETVLAAINHIFTGLMDCDLGGEDYAASALTSALDYRDLCAGTWTEDLPARLHLVEVDKGQLISSEEDDAPLDESFGDERQHSFDPQYARVAAILAEIHSSGQPIYDKALKSVRPVAWRDMAVLLRTSRGRVEALRRELDRAGIPSYAPGRSGFYERPEIGDALSLLAVLDNPRQDIPLAAVLTGPAVGLSPADLARIAIGSSETLAADSATGIGANDFFSKVERYASSGQDSQLRDSLAQFLSRLSGWRDFARREPLDALLQMLYRESGLMAAAAALKNGAQRLANLRSLADHAREFGRFDQQGLTRFLEYISSSRRAAGDSGEAPLLSDQQDVVRVLTVHQAKGLEFPIVVVPDLHREFNKADWGDDVQWDYRTGIGGRHYDLAAFRRYDTLGRRAVRQARKQAAVSEQLRLLYVALTRARERLELVAAVEPGSLPQLTRPRGCDATNWLQWVATQLDEAIRGVETGRPAICGPNGCWEVHYEAGAASGVSTAASTSIIPPAEIELALARIRAVYPSPGSSHLPAKVAVTQLTETAMDLDAERALPLGVAFAKVADIHPSFVRTLEPSAAEVGTAVHKILAAMAERGFANYADGKRVLELRYELVRRRQLSRAHAENASLAQLSQCAADLAHRLPEIVREPCRQFPEVPVNLLVPAREIAVSQGVDPESAGSELVHVQGAIDLLLDDGQTALVLDYKTGYTLDAHELRRIHEQQLLWYCRAAALLLPGRRIKWALYGLGGAGFVGPFDYATS